nr:hypothetical protein [Tanacetum cinerariifolium]
MKARYRECKKELGNLKSAYDENVSVYDQLSKDHDGALNREKGLNKRVEELEGKKKGFEEVNTKQADQIKQLEEELKRKEEDVQAILAATPNVVPASSATFIEQYEKLFDKRYPYVEKVARAYLLDPYGLQNVMPDETGPMPGQGPRATPTASYA